MGSISIEIPARLSALDQIEGAISQAAEQAGFDERTLYACQLAVCEACENIITHGYHGEDQGTIRVTVEPQPGELAIELRDRAGPFNPAAQSSAGTQNQEDPPVGGLGLVILHRVMDEIRYQREGDENTLFLRKIAGEPAD